MCGHSPGWAGHGDSKRWLGEQGPSWLEGGGSLLASIAGALGNCCRDKLIGASQLILARNQKQAECPRECPAHGSGMALCQSPRPEWRHGGDTGNRHSAGPQWPP